MKKLILSIIILLFAVGQGLALTTFYVDPDATSTYDGSAANPWRGLDDGESNEDEMDAVDTALASGDVIVYFSARDAGSDIDEATTVSIQPLRTDASSNRLTLDGMSYYNTNDANPSWSAYSGTSRFSVSNGYYPFDFHDRYSDEAGDATLKNYITVRGFKINSSGGFAVSVAGSHFIFEYNEVLTSGGQVGPAIQFHYSSAGLGVGAATDITFRYNTIHATSGEALYIGGDGNTSTPSHSYIYIYENNIYDAGSRGGEGNCIDLKDELSYVYVYNNRCIDAEDHGITVLSFDHIYVYNNYVDTAKYSGISFGTNLGTGGSGGTYIYNNIIFDTETAGFNAIVLGTGNAAHAIDGVYIYNNTVDGNPHGIYVYSTQAGDVTNVYLKNNQVTNSTVYGMRGANMTVNTNIFYNNNNVYGNGTADYNGIASQTGSNGNVSVDPLYTNAGGDDFTLTQGSPTCFGGTAITGYNTRIDPVTGVAAGSTEEIGTYLCYKGARLQ